VGVIRQNLCVWSFCVGLIANAFSVAAQTSKPPGSTEWDRTVEQAKKEGRVVVSITTSNDLRAAIEKHFERKYGIDVEPVVGRAPVILRKMVDEYKSGIRYFDLHIGGSESAVNSLLPQGLLDPVEPVMLLPEVKDPKQWWGGHIWSDTAKRFIYSSMAQQSESVWCNTQLVKLEDIRSFDDLLAEKWKGKIGLLDPRTPGSGASLWSYLRDIKGEEYLRKLVGQKMLIGRDQRVLAESLARGKLALVMGLGYYSHAPFKKAGLPVQALPTPKEGIYISGGSGHLVVMKQPAHPNAMRVFVNWFLSKEGQDVYSRALGQGTRRLDVDTQWLREIGVIAAKDSVSVEQYYKLENQSEDKINTSREAGAALARKLLD
jgi:iron(III) transport system substrate-binding protein